MNELELAIQEVGKYLQSKGNVSLYSLTRNDLVSIVNAVLYGIQKAGGCTDFPPNEEEKNGF